MSSYHPLLLELQLAHKTSSMYSMKVSTSSMGASLSGTTKWYSGALGADGKVYCAMHQVSNILVIDPMNSTSSRSNLGVSFGSGTNRWSGAVSHPNGSIYFMPRDATSVLEIKSISDKIGLPRDILLSPYLNKI